MADITIDPAAPVFPVQRPGPYVGLVPYSEADAPFFFGRADEIQIISANLRTSPLTLLYGPSGVGKSSILHAGVTWTLRNRSERSRGGADGAPEFAVVVVSAWRDDPVSEILTAVGAELDRLGRPPSVLPPVGGLMGGLRDATQRLGGDLLIILDQFEEYFLYHASEEGPGTFAVDFPRSVESPDMRVNFLAAIREDALARLDVFKGRMTNPFGNRLAINHLDDVHAREAIRGPVAEFNKESRPGTLPVTIEPELVDEVLDQVTAGRVLLGQAGVGAVAEGGRPAARRIETPFLQLVMTRVWDEEMAAGSPILRRSTLEGLGGAERIVRTHLDARMQELSPGELDVAASIFHYLVTPSGTKIAHSADDLADYTEHNREEIEPLLEKLSSQQSRILSPVAPPSDAPGPTRYQIFHDVLAPAILDWRTRYVRRREQETAQRQLELDKQQAETKLRAARKRSRAFLGLALAASFLLLLSVALSWWAVTSRNRAKTQARIANSATAGARALTRLHSDPAKGVALALGGQKSAKTPLAELALRQALPNSRLTAELDTHSGALSHVAVLDDGKKVAMVGADRIVRIWDPESGTVSKLDGHDTGPIYDMEVDQGDDRLVTASQDGYARVWNLSGGGSDQPLKHVLNSKSVPVVAAAFDPSGSRVATGTHGAGIWVWSMHSGSYVRTARLDADNGGSDWINAVAFDASGTRLVAGTGEGDVLLYKRVGSNWSRVFKTDVDTSYVNVVAFAPGSGSTVASGNSDGKVSVLDSKKGESVGGEDRCCYHNVVNAIRYSTDGDEIVAGGGKLAETWSPTSSGYQAIMVGHSDWVYDTSFSPDGRYVLTASSDGTAGIWSAATGRRLLTLSGHTDGVRAAQFTPDGTRAVTVGKDGTARVWDVRTGLEFDTGGYAQEAVWSPDGSRVVTASGDGHVWVWDASTGHPVTELVKNSYLDGAYSVDMSSDGKKILLSGNQPYVEIADASSGALLDYCCKDAEAGTSSFYSAVFTPDDAGILTTSVTREGTDLTLWDVNGRHDSHQILEPFTAINKDHDVDFATISPSDRLLVIHGSGTAELWDSKGSTLIKDLMDVRTVGAFSADGRYLVTDGPGNSGQLWNGETGAFLYRLPGGTAPVTAVGFSPDEKWVVGGDADGMTYVWDLNGDLLATMRMQADYINSIAVSADQRILTASDDDTAKIYRCPTCVPVDQLEQQAQAYLDDLAAHGAGHYLTDEQEASSG